MVSQGCWFLVQHLFYEFPTFNSFLGKFGPKISKLSVLFENWCTQYLKDADSESTLRLLKFRPQNPFLGKFGPKNLKLPVLSKNWYTWYLKDGGSYSNICFMNFQLLICFWANLHQKCQSCSFCLKNGIHSISRMLTLVSTFLFLISN